MYTTAMTFSHKNVSHLSYLSNRSNCYLFKRADIHFTNTYSKIINCLCVFIPLAINLWLESKEAINAKIYVKQTSNCARVAWNRLFTWLGNNKNQTLLQGGWEQNKQNWNMIRRIVDDTVIGFVIAFVANEKVLASTTTHSMFHSYW